MSYFRLLQLDIDLARADQVIRNLLTNAIKFSSEGGLVQLVSKLVVKQFTAASGRTYEACLLIEVIDNGAGIAPENQYKVFREFSQIDAQELQQGKGSGELRGQTYVLWEFVR